MNELSIRFLFFIAFSEHQRGGDRRGVVEE
jgi:hypothetical protein